MNLITFAPEKYIEHLTVLEDKARFNTARLKANFTIMVNSRHYVITGNEGVGKSETVGVIYKRIAEAARLVNYVVKDSTTMLAPNAGFVPAIPELCQGNNMLHIKAKEDTIAPYGNAIIFNDFTSEELVELPESLLMKEFQFDIKPAAKERIVKYLKGIRASSNKFKKTSVNLRTILHIAQTIAHINKLCIVRSCAATP